MTTIKKTIPHHIAGQDHPFPQEAYEPSDDVTDKGIEQVRKKAAPYIEAEEWELIDGFDGKDSKMG